ncbi:MAG TPA: radical SAM family heme chaperone HemW [Gammaproteobacteria bacterium]|nr:radical SAM family heme chaperone HemW [Gammaproteobacteria bacterium]
MNTLLKFRQTIPLSLYIHLPWCVRKCPYCDFNSHEHRGDDFRDRDYIAVLVRDLEFELPRIWGRPVQSVFIGGGTPSLFSIAAMNDLMGALRERLNLHPDTEVTLEANPGTAEAEKFRAFREAGINRLSIGVQSFDDRHLKRLGRIHDSREADAAIGMAREAGFEDINIDIMYGLPEQTVEDAVNDIQRTTDYGLTHISWYQLTLEPNTVFYADPPELPDNDSTWEMQQQGQQLLSAGGYPQYEVSAYAQKNNRCLHNVNYWQFGDYLGIGAGAHGKLTDVAGGTVRRYTRHRIPERYMALAGNESVITGDRQLSREDIALEFMMNALRLVEGFETSLFFERTGLPLRTVSPQLEQAEQQGLIEWDIKKIRPTERGRRYLNDLLQLFNV